MRKADYKPSNEKWVLYLGGFLFTSVAAAIFYATFNAAELTCSRSDDTCTIVRTSVKGVERISFQLSGATGAEKAPFGMNPAALGVRKGSPSHIVIHTRYGDVDLTDYDSGFCRKRMDQNIEGINAFIGNRTSGTLVVRQDDRPLSLAVSLPFLAINGFLIWLWRIVKKYSATTPGDSGSQSVMNK